jgi:hypothetical protein
MQALEVIKILLGFPNIEYGVIHNLDGKNMEIDRVELEIDPHCPAHAGIR